MKNLNDQSMNPAAQTTEKTLRERASERLQIQQDPDISTLDPEEAGRLIHELRVHRSNWNFRTKNYDGHRQNWRSQKKLYRSLRLRSGGLFVREQGTDPEGKPHRSHFVGCASTGIIKQPLSKFILPEDQDIYYHHHNQLSAQDTAVLESRNETRFCELRMIKTDKTLFWAQLNATISTYSHGTPIFRIVLSDITRRKEAIEAQRQSELRERENRYRKLFKEHSAVMLILEAETGRIVDANNAAAWFYGWSLDELREKSILNIDALPSNTLRAILVKAAGSEGISAEFCHRRADGSIREVEFFSNGMESGGNKFIIAIVNDITERKQAEEKIKAALAEKDVMLKEIHHRVKNNLQVISSLVSLQTDNLTDDRIRDELNDVRDRVRTMALVHEKLYQASNLAQLNFADYAASLLRSLWRSHSTLAAKVRLNLALAPVEVSIEKAVPCGLILNELASNALKHAFPNNRGGEVLVSLELNPATCDINLRVRDNGVGLPAGLDWSQSHSLGLRLVKLLAGQLNGTVETGTGPGSEFRVTFPLNQCHS